MRPMEGIINKCAKKINIEKTIQNKRKVWFNIKNLKS